MTKNISKRLGHKPNVLTLLAMWQIRRGLEMHPHHFPGERDRGRVRTIARERFTSEYDRPWSDSANPDWGHGGTRNKKPPK